MLTFEQFKNIDLKQLADDFLEKENISKEYLNKKDRDGMCWWFAKNFSEYLTSKNITNSIINMTNKKGGNHLITKVNDNFIDFTEKSVANNFPVITKKSDYTKYDVFDEYKNFKEFIKKWNMTSDEWITYEKKLKKPKGK